MVSRPLGLETCASPARTVGCMSCARRPKTGRLFFVVYLIFKPKDVESGLRARHQQGARMTGEHCKQVPGHGLTIADRDRFGVQVHNAVFSDTRLQAEKRTVGCFHLALLWLVKDTKNPVARAQFGR